MRARSMGRLHCANSSGNPLACFKSSVSKPSVISAELRRQLTEEDSLNGIKRAHPGRAIKNLHVAKLQLTYLSFKRARPYARLYICAIAVTNAESPRLLVLDSPNRGGEQPATRPTSVTPFASTTVAQVFPPSFRSPQRRRSTSPHDSGRRSVAPPRDGPGATPPGRPPTAGRAR
jgi:hypothetical protein